LVISRQWLHSLHAGEKIGVGDALGPNRVLERSCDVGLAGDVFETLRAPLTGEN